MCTYSSSDFFLFLSSWSYPLCEHFIFRFTCSHWHQAIKPPLQHCGKNPDNHGNNTFLWDDQDIPPVTATGLTREVVLHQENLHAPQQHLQGNRATIHHHQDSNTTNMVKSYNTSLSEDLPCIVHHIMSPLWVICHFGYFYTCTPPRL